MKKLICLSALFIFTACRRENPPEPEVEETVSTELQSVFQEVDAAELATVTELRSDVEAGKEVMFKAKVMGSKHPFVDSRAVMVVGDAGTLDSCDVMEGEDHCATPWDVCCEDPKAIAKGTATVQVVDGEGRVLKQGLKGINGLKELSHVRIKGTVDPVSTEQALVVNATHIDVL